MLSELLMATGITTVCVALALAEWRRARRGRRAPAELGHRRSVIADPR